MTSKPKTKDKKKRERLNERLKRIRTEQGYTLTEMALALDISLSFLNQIESGSKLLPAKKMRKFCEVTGYAQEDLLEVDVRLPAEELQDKIDRDPYFMKLLRILIKTRQPTRKIIRFITKERPVEPDA